MTLSNPIPQATQWLLSKAADRLEPELRERLLEEWAADVDDASSWHAKLRVAGSIYMARNAWPTASHARATGALVRFRRAISLNHYWEAMLDLTEALIAVWSTSVRGIPKVSKPRRKG
jgi:hypothetical protein